MDAAMAFGPVARSTEPERGHARGFRRIVATAVIPISPIKFYELLTHPENSLIFRGIERCTYRRILADDAAGRQVVEVENESGRFGAGALSRGGGCRQRV